jgi:hypothetical protein
MDQLGAGEALSADLRATLLHDAAEPQVLIRLGWPPIAADLVPPTGRRPVDDTIRPLDEPWQPPR